MSTGLQVDKAVLCTQLQTLAPNFYYQAAFAGSVFFNGRVNGVSRFLRVTGGQTVQVAWLTC